MSEPQPVVSQLVTRIPSALRRRLKVHCIQHDTTLSEFVIVAILERLDRVDRRSAR